MKTSTLLFTGIGLYLIYRVGKNMYPDTPAATVNTKGNIPIPGAENTKTPAVLGTTASGQMVTTDAVAAADGSGTFPGDIKMNYNVNRSGGGATTRVYQVGEVVPD